MNERDEHVSEKSCLLQSDTTPTFSLRARSAVLRAPSPLALKKLRIGGSGNRSEDKALNEKKAFI